MSVEAVGCCGAYCGTCPVFHDNICRGCKIGYRTGERKLEKAKCAVKVCCIGNGYDSCADCGRVDVCATINGFYAKKGYKYGKYREAVEFIRAHGYGPFIRVADRWNAQYGKMD